MQNETKEQRETVNNNHLQTNAKCYKVSALALGICCVAMLAFPIHTNRHHILETYIKTITTKIRECAPTIKQDLNNVVLKAKVNEAYAASRNP